MKSYGKVDETWNDERIRALIEDALGMAKDGKKRHAIGQDGNGNVVVTGDGPDRTYIYACWTTRRSRDSPEDDLVLSDHCVYSKYSVEQMIPRVRNALTRGILDFGGLGFLSEGREQLQGVSRYARMLVKMHGEPFITGWIDKKTRTATQSKRDNPAGIMPDMSKSIVIAPLSEREHFVDYASCVVTKHGCWSLLDRIPDSAAYREYGRVRRMKDLKNTCVSDRRSIYTGWPGAFMYDTILEYGENKRRARAKK